jgi:hypothetical protein
MHKPIVLNSGHTLRSSKEIEKILTTRIFSISTNWILLWGDLQIAALLTRFEVLLMCNVLNEISPKLFVLTFEIFHNFFRTMSYQIAYNLISLDGSVFCAYDSLQNVCSHQYTFPFFSILTTLLCYIKWIYQNLLLLDTEIIFLFL